MSPIGDTFLGSMIEDDHAEFGFTTGDELLRAELEDFSRAYREALQIENLPVALHEQYGECLIGWSWTADKHLKIIAHYDVDLIDFAGVLRDQINEVVLFEKPLIVYLSKEGSGEVEEIHVNS